MRWKRLFGLAAALVALAAGRAAAQEVAGVVLEGRSGRPLEGARVAAGARETRTDSRGRFTLTGLTGSEVSIRVSMIGYRPVIGTYPVGKTDLRITISEQAINLAEIVVTGTPQAVEKDRKSVV